MQVNLQSSNNVSFGGYKIVKFDRTLGPLSGFKLGAIVYGTKSEAAKLANRMNEGSNTKVCFPVGEKFLNSFGSDVLQEKLSAMYLALINKSKIFAKQATKVEEFVGKREAILDRMG